MITTVRFHPAIYYSSLTYLATIHANDHYKRDPTPVIFLWVLASLFRLKYIPSAPHRACSLVAASSGRALYVVRIKFRSYSSSSYPPASIIFSILEKVDKELSLLTIPLFPLSRLPRIFLEYFSTMSRPTSKVKRPTRKSLGSHRSSLSAQKTEILINVYDLLPVRIPF